MSLDVFLQLFCFVTIFLKTKETVILFALFQTFFGVFFKFFVDFANLLRVYLRKLKWDWF